LKNIQRKYFTLLELTAVITILILLTAVSTVYVGRERKGAALEQALRDFKVFCAQARADSMRDGAVRKLVFYPEEKLFRIEKPEQWNQSEAVILAEDVESGNMPYVVLEAIDPEQEAELAAADDGDEEVLPEEEKVRQWAFPEKLGVEFELPDFEGIQNMDESLELWRYTRGGAGRLLHELTLQIGESAYRVTISDFSGLLEINPVDTAEGQRVW